MEDQKRTFVGKLIESVIGLFIGNFETWIRKIANKVPPKIKLVLENVVEIVENIKKFADSPVLDFLTAVIPGEWDDKLKEQIRAALAKVMYIEDQTVLKLSGTTGMIVNTDADNLHIIATKLTKELTGMGYGQSAITIEAAYQKYKLDKAENA